MSDAVLINPRDLTATVPDGPVNRHVQVQLFLDPVTGAITGQYDLDYHRDLARNAAGDLPPEQTIGDQGANAADIDKLRAEINDLRAQLAARDASQGSE